MQEEKDRTTTPQPNGAKHRRRRKKNHQQPQENTVQTVQEQQNAPAPEAAPLTAPETPETPQPPEETAAPATAPETPAQEAEPKVEDASPVTEPEKQAPSETLEQKASDQTEAELSQEPKKPETEDAAPAEPEEEAAQSSEETETASETPEAAEESAKQLPEAAEAAPEESTPETPEPAEKTAEQPSETAEAVPEEATPESPEPAEGPDTAETPVEGQTEAETPDQDKTQTPAEPAEAELPEEPAEPAEESDTPEEELPEEDEKRLSDMTRTVQLSVEQIMAQVNEETPEGETSAVEEPSEPDSLSDQMRSGLSGMAKWLLLVVFVVLVIAGFGVAWLYRSATPDMLPQITVTFAGQTVEPTAYKWKVPVVGNLFKRTYADTLSSTPVTLEETVEQVSPDFIVSPSDYRTEVTLTDSNDETLFEGDVDAFSAFRFTANGTYNAKLVVHSDASAVPGDTTVTGSETWQFAFTVGVRPSVRLSSTTVNQGSVVAVRVGDTLDGEPPVITTELENAGFVKASTGWVCYLPIPWNEPAGTQTIEISAGGYTETLELKIRATEWAYKDYYSNSQRVSPYIGEKDIPAELEKLLASSESEIAWSDGSFVQPFLNTIDVELAFGTTEYVGRSYSERSANTGTGGRTWTNMALNTEAGELLIAPASGKILLAKDLGGDYGYTLVIDHGAGVKSIFYNLQGVSVKAGTAVKQGQVLATCGRTTVAEMRIGTVPIDPLQVWRGQCDALKNY